jgi:5'-methylthioadenosine phosphorylase
MLGFIGGTGLYDLPGLRKVRYERVPSPFGRPSDDVLLGELDGQPLAFLPRHGRGHVVPPHLINYRANLDVFKRLGVTDVVSLSAVGSLREDLPPGTFVLVDQFVDRTRARVSSFFGEGLVAHVGMAEPVCARVGDALEQAAADAGAPARRGGTYIVIDGPQFSTRGESLMYRQWGCDVIGMTNMPEAKLAREAELCYATVAMVTDWDCWHPEHGTVTIPEIMKVLADNGDRARDMIRRVAPLLATHPSACPHGCDRALDSALLTVPGARDPAMITKLDAVAGRVLLHD